MDTDHAAKRVSSVSLGALTAACLGALAISLFAILIWREFAVSVLGVPQSLSSLRAPALAVSVLLPIFGNGFGYFMAYRKPLNHARFAFLLPGVFLSVVGLAISLGQLDSWSAASATVTIIVVLVTPVVAVAVLTYRLKLAQVGAAPTAQAPDRSLP